MLLWLKKLLKPKWLVEECCMECYEKHYCGGCGRGIDSFAGYFYTYKSALKAATEWVEQQQDNEEFVEYKIVVTEISGHTTVMLHFTQRSGEEGDCTMFATIDERRYW